MNKFISYLLNITFLIGVFIGSVFYAGPTLIAIAFKNPIAGMNQGNLQYLSIDYLNSRKSNYIELIVQVDEIPSKSIFFTREFEHRGLLNFLVDEQILPVQNSYAKLDSILPFQMSFTQLQQVNKVHYNVGELGIDQLKAGDHFIIGSIPGYGKRIFAFISGIFVMTLGIGSSALAVLSLIQNFRTYRKTGDLPSLPNSFDSKVNGIKFLFGLKSKENEEQSTDN